MLDPIEMIKDQALSIASESIHHIDPIVFYEYSDGFTEEEILELGIQGLAESFREYIYGTLL